MFAKLNAVSVGKSEGTAENDEEAAVVTPSESKSRRK